MPEAPPQDEPEYSHEEGLREKKGNTMHTEYQLDAVQAEVAYRTEQIRAAARSARQGRVARASRRLLNRRPADVEIPEQQRREARERAGVAGITR